MRPPSGDDFRGECALRPAKQRGEHLAGLVGIIVNRLLAADDELDAFGFSNGFEDFGDGERLGWIVGLHQNGAVGAHGERGAQGLLRLLRADRHGDDFLGLAGLFQTQRLFDGDFVERVHRHFDIGKVNAGPIRLDADFDVVINDPFDRHQYFHV